MPDRPFAQALSAALFQADQTSDRELLRRFVATRDNDSFELLLRRHANLVWKVCRGVLHDNRQSAEDAFQATFMALAQQAGAISQGELLPAWLFRVARHSALRVRKLKASRTLEPLPDAFSTAARLVVGSVDAAEIAAIVAEEVFQLPTRYRDPGDSLFL